MLASMRAGLSAGEEDDPSRFQSFHCKYVLRLLSTVYHAGRNSFRVQSESLGNLEPLGTFVRESTPITREFHGHDAQWQMSCTT